MIRQTIPTYEENEISLLDILVALAESWRLLVFGPLLAGVLAGGLSFLWPDTYESVTMLRMSEEDSALLHSAPVLDVIVAKFDLLKHANGIQEDARKDLSKKLTISFDKRTKLLTLTAKADTPDLARALGMAAAESMLNERRLKGKDKELIEKTILINQQSIDMAQDAADIIQRSMRKSSLTDVGQESAVKNLAVMISDIRKYTIENTELLAKLEGHGEEVFVQKASFPQRKSAPRHGLVFVIAVLLSCFVLLLFVFVRKVWSVAAQDQESFRKMTAIKRSLTWRV